MSDSTRSYDHSPDLKCPMHTCDTMEMGMVLHRFGKLKPIPVPVHTCDTLSWVYPYLCHALVYIPCMCCVYCDIMCLAVSTLDHIRQLVYSQNVADSTSNKGNSSWMKGWSWNDATTGQNWDWDSDARCWIDWHQWGWSWRHVSSEKAAPMLTSPQLAYLN
jgi:hypothetical protein